MITDDERIEFAEKFLEDMIEAFDKGNVEMRSPDIDFAPDGPLIPFHVVWTDLVRSHLERVKRQEDEG